VHKLQYYLGKVTIEQATNDELKGVPDKYQWHLKVFSKVVSQWLPSHTVWDHTIELLPGAPSMLSGWLLLLMQEEVEEAQKFVKEHLEQNTI
jgi:uncharacterized membrane protein